MSYTLLSLYDDDDDVCMKACSIIWRDNGNQLCNEAKSKPATL